MIRRIKNIVSSYEQFENFIESSVNVLHQNFQYPLNPYQYCIWINPEYQKVKTGLESPCPMGFQNKKSDEHPRSVQAFIGEHFGVSVFIESLGYWACEKIRSEQLKNFTHALLFLLFFLSLYGPYRASVSQFDSWREQAGSAHSPVEATKRFYPYRSMGKSEIVAPTGAERIISLTSTSSILWPAPPTRPIPSLQSILPTLKYIRTILTIKMLTSELVKNHRSGVPVINT